MQHPSYDVMMQLIALGANWGEASPFLPFVDETLVCIV